jgi:hypothetical protein
MHEYSEGHIYSFYTSIITSTVVVFLKLKENKHTATELLTPIRNFL